MIYNRLCMYKIEEEKRENTQREGKYVEKATRSIDALLLLILEVFRENGVAKTEDSCSHMSNLCSVSRMYRVYVFIRMACVSGLLIVNLHEYWTLKNLGAKSSRLILDVHFQRAFQSPRFNCSGKFQDCADGVWRCLRNYRSSIFSFSRLISRISRYRFFIYNSIICR